MSDNEQTCLEDFRFTCNSLLNVTPHTARRQSQVLWAGENVVVFRTGRQPRRGGCLTYLFDKGGLILRLRKYNTSPLLSLASLTHPLQKELLNNPQLLHSTAPNEKAVFVGRWCKTMASRVLAHARQQDRLYDDDFALTAEAYEVREHVKKECRRRKHAINARVVVAMKKLARDCNGSYGAEPGAGYRDPHVYIRINEKQQSRIEVDTKDSECVSLNISRLSIRYIEPVLRAIAEAHADPKFKQQEAKS